jgi:hypothetical protein
MSHSAVLVQRFQVVADTDNVRNVIAAVDLGLNVQRRLHPVDRVRRRCTSMSSRVTRPPCLRGSSGSNCRFRVSHG